MYLYLIRHGIAIDADPRVLDPIASDGLRPLTNVGRKKIAQVADRLGYLELNFDLIFTSPLVRARQTADILIDKQISTKLEISEHLKPMGRIQSWLNDWHSRSDLHTISTLALVGHEPNLSQWAELLIFGQVYNRLILKKGGIVGLKFADTGVAIGTAQLSCAIAPKYFISTVKKPEYL
jgi:phosphohistidine phosphatase